MPSVINQDWTKISGVISVTGKIKCNNCLRSVPIGQIQIKAAILNFASAKYRKDWRVKKTAQEIKTGAVKCDVIFLFRKNSRHPVEATSKGRRRREKFNPTTAFLRRRSFYREQRRGFSHWLVVDRSPVVKCVFLVTDPNRRRVPIKTLARRFVSW